MGGAAAAAESGGKKIRIGIVGGGFGTSFYWHLHPECEVAAVSDLRPERIEALVKTYGCKTTYPSLEELVKDKTIDAVAIFTGAPDHARHVLLALEHGKHVICAVPAALTLEDCQKLLDAVKRTGLTYMMAETSYYRQEIITTRRWFEAGKFGEIVGTEAEYHHDGLETLFWEGGKPGGKRTWRYGYPPFLYPTHSTSMLVGVTGERLTEVVGIGWGDEDPILKDNDYKNPFWCGTALYKTDLGHAFRMQIYWRTATMGTERARWMGSKMSFHMPEPNGLGPVVVERIDQLRAHQQEEYWKTELPPPLRIPSGHGGSHTFLTHEFIDALARARRPAVDIHEALAYTAPGIVAQASALKGGVQMKVPDFGKAGSGSLI